MTSSLYNTYFSLSAFVSVPSNVLNVIVKSNDTDIILKWDVVSNIDNNTYIYTLESRDEPLVNCTNFIAKGNEVTCHISDLIPATNYSFTLYTEFADLRSTGFNFYNTTSKWLLFFNSYCLILWIILTDHIAGLGKM